MAIIDLVLLGVVVLSGLISLMRGFIREALSLASWITAFIVARYFSGNLATLLSGQIETHSFRWAIAFVALFVATLVVLSMLNHLLSYIVRATGLTGTDRALGVVFGAVRGLVIVVALVFMAQFTPVTGDQWWQESVLIPHLETIADWARKALPEAASGVAGY